MLLHTCVTVTSIETSALIYATYRLPHQARSDMICRCERPVIRGYKSVKPMRIFYCYGSTYEHKFRGDEDVGIEFVARRRTEGSFRASLQEEWYVLSLSLNL
jgi:hypothetical protein